MLKIYKNNILQDYMRTAQGNRGYGLQMCTGKSPLQIYNAYSDNLAITYFNLNRIDSGNVVLTTTTVSNDLIKYENGQYLIDRTKLFSVSFPEGVYYYEFSNDTNIFVSEIFKIQDINQPFLASSSILSSSSFLISRNYE